MSANLLDYDLEGLAAFCDRLGEKRFRATQLFRWIHQKDASSFDAMTDLANDVFRNRVGFDNGKRTFNGHGSFLSCWIRFLPVWQSLVF